MPDEDDDDGTLSFEEARKMAFEYEIRCAEASQDKLKLVDRLWLNYKYRNYKYKYKNERWVNLEVCDSTDNRECYVVLNEEKVDELITALLYWKEKC